MFMACLVDVVEAISLAVQLLMKLFIMLLFQVVCQLFLKLLVFAVKMLNDSQ